MSAELLMGVDLGTSSVKAVVIAPDGRMLARAAVEYPVLTPRPGWAEQDPVTWVEATLATMRQALSDAGVPGAAIAAVGLSGQMHGTVCLDAQGTVLHPAIIWADQRSRAQVARVMLEIGTARLGAWTGNPLATGFMLATWLWLREEAPEIARATRTLLLPKDYLRYALTGTLGTEPSDASSTLLFDTARCCWSAPLLAALDIDVSLLPPVHDSAAVAGTLLPGIAEATSLLPGTPVVYGASDQACQALGHGVLEPGVLSLTIGTGGQLFAPVVAPVYDPDLRLHLFCHALPDRWHLEAATLSAGLALRWLRDQIFAGTSYSELAAWAAEVPPGAEGLFFLPYLAGERTPHMDPSARAAFLGLTLRHHRGHLIRAAMEGVVFALRQGLELMESLSVPVTRVVASGGAAQSPLWLQLQADILNRPIDRTRTVEAAAVGAAFLAGVGSGLVADLPTACRLGVQWEGEAILPEAANAARYARAYAAYCKLYAAVEAYQSAQVS